MSRIAALLVTAVLTAGPASAQGTLFEVDGDSTFKELGHGVAGIEDIDGDGLSDFVATGFTETSGVKRAYLRYFSGANGTVIDTVPNLGPPTFGPNIDAHGSLHPCGDIDGDGVTDTIMGVWETPTGFGQPTTAGTACVVSSATRAVLFILNGLAIGDDFGASAAGVGDIDGDGTPDFIIGAPQWFTPLGIGYFQVFSGGTGQQIVGFSGSGPGSGYGVGVDGGGDFDADGVPDFVVASPSNNGLVSPGSITVFSGATQGGSLLLTSSGFAPSAQDFGYQVAMLGDVNGDGFADVAVSNKGSTLATPYVEVLLGPAGAQHFLTPFPNAFQRGCVMRSIADFDGDGVRDLIVGSGPGAFAATPALVSGVTGTIRTLPIPSAPGSVQALGHMVDGDGDGLPEILAGDSDQGFGRVRVVSTLATPIPPTTLTLGTGYAPPGMTAPSLGAGLATLGSPWALTLTSSLPSQLGFLAVAPGPPNPVQILPGRTVYPNLLPQGFSLLPFFSDPAGGLTAQTTWPANPALAGQVFVIQAYLPSAAGGLNTASLSNGLSITIGT